MGGTCNKWNIIKIEINIIEIQRVGWSSICQLNSIGAEFVQIVGETMAKADKVVTSFKKISVSFH